MYINGAKGYFDAIGMHPYVFPGGIVAHPSNGWSDLAWAHDVMALNGDGDGDGDKKVWLTEFGAPTSAPGADGAASRNRPSRSPTCWRGRRPPVGGPAFIYRIRDIDSANPDDREDNFGARLAAEVRRGRARPVADHCVSPARIVGDIH
jgi:hypothetical protein